MAAMVTGPQRWLKMPRLDAYAACREGLVLAIDGGGVGGLGYQYSMAASCSRNPQVDMRWSTLQRHSLVGFGRHKPVARGCLERGSSKTDRDALGLAPPAAHSCDGLAVDDTGPSWGSTTGNLWINENGGEE